MAKGRITIDEEAIPCGQPNQLDYGYTTRKKRAGAADEFVNMNWELVEVAESSTAQVVRLELDCTV